MPSSFWSVALVCSERRCSIFPTIFPSSFSRSPLVAGVCAVFGLFSIDIGLHLQYRYRANRVKGMYEQDVDESLSRYARERRAAHAKGKLLMDHGVWWISSLGSQQAINFLLCR